MNDGILPVGLRGLRAAMAALLAVGVSSATARAATTATGTCPATAVSTPFSPWGDANSYMLVPGGDFEHGLAGWTLTGGAGTVAGSESFNATGSAGAYALNLPAGATAQSPQMCVTAADPTFRLFTAASSATSSVVAQVVYQAPHGAAIVVPVGVISPSSGWGPTSAMATGAALASLVGGGSAQISLRFTAIGGASRLDDVFVDPRMKS